LAQQYNDILLSSTNVTTLPVTHSVAQLAAELRAEHKLKTPDAVQLATALSQHATIFMTNDRDFPAMRDIEILKLRDIEI
jgi:predicted nucleic acid-binding protein